MSSNSNRVSAHNERGARLASSLSSAQLAVEMMGEGFVRMDGHGLLVFASTSFSAMMGRSPGELIGQSFIGFFDPAQREHLASLCAVRTQERVGCEATLMIAGGRTLPVRVALKRIVAGDAAAAGTCALVSEVPAQLYVPSMQEGLSQASQSVSSQVLTAQETERKRIAADLHDGLGQLLGAMKFGLESVSCALGKNAIVEATSALDGVTGTVKEALEEVRRMAMNLRPSTLDDLGIMATLSWFIREFQVIYRAITVETDFRINESDVPDTLKVAVFRLVQEAMSNVAKHAQATRVKITIERIEGNLRLMIEDNGVGFDPTAVASRTGAARRFGHTCSRERVEWSGGKITIQRTGTRREHQGLLAGEQEPRRTAAGLPPREHLGRNHRTYTGDGSCRKPGAS
jgi:PAS domain S-box-containing protein